MGAQDGGCAHGGGQLAAQRGQPEAQARGRRDRLRHRQLPRPVLREVVLRERGQLDHPLIGGLGGVAEGEQAVVHQHEADGARVGVPRVQLGAQPRQLEAGHDIGNHHDAVAVDLAHALFAAGGVRHRDQGVGMGVVDKFPRQQAVQDRLNGRHGRGRVGQADLQLLRHLQVGELRQCGQPEQVRQAARREARSLDGFEIPAATLDVKDVLVLAEDIRLAHLHRGVAAAVQDERRIAAQQARTVHPLSEIAGERGGFLVIPKAFHGWGLSAKVRSGEGRRKGWDLGYRRVFLRSTFAPSRPGDSITSGPPRPWSRGRWRRR